MQANDLLRPIVNQDFVRRTVKPVTEYLSAEEKSDFVAGEESEDALSYADELNDNGITALIDILGEHVEDPDKAASAHDEYQELQNDIASEELDAHISVKPTHIGLDVEDRNSYNVCQRNLRGLAGNAAENDQFLWIDMESSNYTEDTIDLYTDLLDDEFDNVGVCIQSYLKDSKEDIAELAEHDENASIRLVKGAYNEPEDLAYQEPEQVDESFQDILDDLFASDTYTAVATHDEELIDYAKQLEEEHDKPREDFEFQFLMGVKEDTKRDLADEGYDVADYVPYGPEWFDYSWRRIQENPEKNIPRFLKSLA